MAAESESCSCRTAFLDSGSPSGTVVEIGGVKCYFAKATDSNGRVIVDLTDVFGWELVNARLRADAWAQEGYDCYIPDLHSGDSLPAARFNFLIEPSKGACSGLTKVTKLVIALPTFLSWAKRHQDGQTHPILLRVLTALRQQQGVRKIGVEGFCWGGRYALQLAGGSVPSAPMVDAVMAAHPSNIKMEDACPPIAQPTGRPTCIIFSEKDMQVSPASREKSKAILRCSVTTGPVATGGVHGSEVHVFAGTDHGFAVRGNEADPVVAKARTDAFAAAVAFMEKHL